MPIEYSARGIYKSYGYTEVLKNINLTFTTGEIHALVGHNGAGKSTILRILAGVEKADRGIIRLNNEPAAFSSPRDAQLSGIVCVYQELRLVNDLTVAENIFLGQELARGGLLKKKDMNRVAATLLNDHGLDVSPIDKVRQLSHPKKQMVEIISALHKNVRFLLLDEPTTSLQFHQIEQFLETLRKMVTTQELGVVLVTHKLNEVYGVADKITVLCDGEVVLGGTTSEISQHDVTSYIIGKDRTTDSSVDRDATKNYKNQVSSGQPNLKVQHLKTTKVKDVTLEAFPQQVLGIYGLGGSGRTEFLRAIYGIDPILSGLVEVKGKRYAPKSPRDAIRIGIAYITEERKSDGFNPLMNSVVNIGLPVVTQFSKFGFIRKSQFNKAVLEQTEPLQIRGDLFAPMQSLSGGNQQKVLFVRAIMQNSDILLLDEPTKGIDIGAKNEIYSLIRSLVNSQSLTVIVVSSEEEEILALSDRIAVFRSGVFNEKIYQTHEMTSSKLRALALGEGY